MAGVAKRQDPDGTILAFARRKGRAWIAEAAETELDRLWCGSRCVEHLMADVPLGVWLSGGLDSSTVVHYASEVLGSSLGTFSTSFMAEVSTRRLRAPDRELIWNRSYLSLI